MFPINFVDYFRMGFGKPVLELAHEQGAGILAIKAMSKGTWPSGAEKTRQWWYRVTETMEEVDLATRFALSHPNVASSIPPSFLDLVDRAVEVGRSYRPISKAGTTKLMGMAEECLELFRSAEERVALGRGVGGPFYPDSPHECC
jgi:predicted aldo/keto reductase-like oxidoreductase